MKRDLDLVRRILLAWEASPQTSFSESQWPKIPNHEDKAVRYHLMLMIQAGLIHVEKPKTAHPISIGRQDNKNFFFTGSDAYSISWQGHEFLSALRDDNNWNEVKKVMTRAGGIVLDIAVELGKEMIKRAAFNQLGSL